MFFLLLTIAIVFAPILFANLITAEPTPPDAPVIRIFSFALALNPPAKLTKSEILSFVSDS